MGGRCDYGSCDRKARKKCPDCKDWICNVHAYKTHVGNDHFVWRCRDCQNKS